MRHTTAQLRGNISLFPGLNRERTIVGNLGVCEIGVNCHIKAIHVRKQTNRFKPDLLLFKFGKQPAHATVAGLDRKKAATQKCHDIQLEIKSEPLYYISFAK